MHMHIFFKSEVSVSINLHIFEYFINDNKKVILYC